MGVTGLWMLLAPGGRQVSMESLSGQTLAVDASIWLTQFVKAMRDPDDGTMMRNAHLLGTFYRISKLLTHGIRPVFVFDGDTPAIKLKTLQQRRSRREKSQDTLTQTAKKLLIKQQREKGSKQLPPSEVPRSPAAKPVEAFQYDAMSSEEKSADDGNDSDYDATWMVDVENFEAYQRNRRQDARETFLTLAGKPEEYSMAQISTFLKASKLKRDMNSRKSAIDSPESGRRIASEGGRRYIYTKASAPHALDESSVGRSSEHVRIQAAKSVDATAKQDCAVFSPTTLDTKHPSWFSAGKKDAPVVLDWATDEVFVKCDLPNAFKLASDAPPSDLAHETSKQSSHDDHTPVQAKAASSTPDDESDIEWEDVVAPPELEHAVSTQADKSCSTDLGTTSPFDEKPRQATLGSDTSDFEWEENTDEVPSKPLPTQYNEAATSSDVLERLSPAKELVHSKDDDEGKEDVTTSALHAAMSTATNLTQWAAGAVKRAILAHKQLGTQFEAATQSHSPLNKTASPETMRYLPRGSPEESPMRYLPRDNAVPQALPSPLDESEADLRKLRNQKLRDVDGVTDEMKSQVMDLLRLFGVPFVVCPMEAEAQCATLEQLGLVQGIITDDSDIFAFGGKKVYKNMFKDSKFVEAYFAADLERELGLDQERMIALALLLGSDYTDGINGIGIVNAAEIVGAFGGLEGLRHFGTWVNSFDITDDLKKPKKVSADELAALSPLERFKLTHQSIRRNWNVSAIFPNPHVIKAYQYPDTDKSTARFSWSVPDLANLRVFCGQEFGWPIDTVDSKLLPVVRAVSRGFQAQTRIDGYFTSYNDNIKYAKIRSKRLKAVVNDIKGLKKPRKHEHD
ncbi:hypothetical protein, variant 2 [Aphanomyces astaci]|uniref:XPG-I domain-containing protein n=1 Tax=Aphanomyces astaci TaxID=112090 RepID=W4GMF3_APHAT|nr:hypothetical protein, variant 2 [Aphanomyces astaci]ETV80048.1 hypothetical protein, variant 2 [Aphanomyces astaci]|eukprot:XP_009829972.1 hypothetical protein, variant 2 [Aphanomyces astaci]